VTCLFETEGEGTMETKWWKLICTLSSKLSLHKNSI